MEIHEILKIYEMQDPQTTKRQPGIEHRFLKRYQVATQLNRGARSPNIHVPGFLEIHESL